jgi:hypothetical protein
MGPPWFYFVNGPPWFILRVKAMDESTSDVLPIAPPLMPWREFADWIRMADDHNTVWGWIRNGYLPSHKVGKHVMVNVALLTTQLLEKESSL